MNNQEMLVILREQRTLVIRACDSEVADIDRAIRQVEAGIALGIDTLPTKTRATLLADSKTAHPLLTDWDGTDVVIEVAAPAVTKPLGGKIFKG